MWLHTKLMDIPVVNTTCLIFSFLAFGNYLSAARLLTIMMGQHHITQVLDYHGSQYCFRIDFKILLIAFKPLHGLAPSFIFDLILPYMPVRTLRSSGRRLLTVPGARLKTKGVRAFTVRAPGLWNDLPEDIRSFTCAFLPFYMNFNRLFLKLLLLLS